MDPRSVAVSDALFQAMGDVLAPSSWGDGDSDDAEWTDETPSAPFLEQSSSSFTLVAAEAALRTRTAVRSEDDFWRMHCIASERNVDSAILARSIFLFQVDRLCRRRVARSTRDAARAVLNSHNVMRLLLVHCRRQPVEERLILSIGNPGDYELLPPVTLSRVVHATRSRDGIAHLRGVGVSLEVTTSALEEGEPETQQDLVPLFSSVTAGSRSRDLPERQTREKGWVQAPAVIGSLQTRPRRELAALGSVARVVVEPKAGTCTGWLPGRTVRVYGYVAADGAQSGCGGEEEGRGDHDVAPVRTISPPLAVLAGWTCARCSFNTTYGNGDVLPSDPCLMCGGAPPSWSCARCTLINDGTARMCAACATARP